MKGSSNNCQNEQIVLRSWQPVPKPFYLNLTANDAQGNLNAKFGSTGGFHTQATQN